MTLNSDWLMFLGEQSGQGLKQIGELSLAFVLSALIGLEREIHQKSAGLRTHTLVGIASALIMLISKNGFTDVLVDGRIVVDPSRVAAQVVSGIGFIGGGLIFVHRDSVRGLTTAAIVWITAAIGMACGAGLPILALFTTFGHFIVVFLFHHLAGRLPGSRCTPSVLQVSYEEEREILRDVLAACIQYKFAISQLKIQRALPSVEQKSRSFGAGLDEGHPRSVSSSSAAKQGQSRPKKIATVILGGYGTGSITELAVKLADIDGVVSVSADDGDLSAGPVGTGF